MIEIIQNKVLPQIEKSVKKYAKQFGCEHKHVSILIPFWEPELYYWIYKGKDYRLTVNTKELLGIGIHDLIGKQVLVPVFIQNTLIRFSEERDIDIKNVRLMLRWESELLIDLFDKDRHISTLELEDVFSEEYLASMAQA